MKLGLAVPLNECVDDRFRRNVEVWILVCCKNLFRLALLIFTPFGRLFLAAFFLNEDVFQESTARVAS